MGTQDALETKGHCRGGFWFPPTVSRSRLLDDLSPSNPSSGPNRVILVCSLRLYYLNRQIQSSNPTLTAAAAACCTQIQLGYAIVATTVPCLKPFMAAYERPRSSSYKTSGGQYSSGISNSSAFHSKTRKSAISLEGIKVPTSGEPSTDPLALRPDNNTHRTIISNPDPNRAVHSSDSNDSRQLIIKKVTGWSIESRTRSSRDEGLENEIQSIEG